jgi:hypothetical protein
MHLWNQKEEKKALEANQYGASIKHHPYHANTFSFPYSAHLSSCGFGGFSGVSTTDPS